MSRNQSGGEEEGTYSKSRSYDFWGQKCPGGGIESLNPQVAKKLQNLWGLNERVVACILRGGGGSKFHPFKLAEAEGWREHPPIGENQKLHHRSGRGNGRREGRPEGKERLKKGLKRKRSLARSYLSGDLSNIREGERLAND